MENTIAKAAKWTLLFRRLAKPSTGVHTLFMRQLYTTVAIPKIMYAVDVWFIPLQWKEGQQKTSGSVGLVHKLTSIQHIATLAITGAMHTTASDTLEAHADICPIELLLLDACNHAAYRLASLPQMHPLSRPVKVCARRLVKRHPSPLHILLHTLGIHPEKFETVTPAVKCPNMPVTFHTEIACT